MENGVTEWTTVQTLFTLFSLVLFSYNDFNDVIKIPMQSVGVANYLRLRMRVLRKTKIFAAASVNYAAC